MLFFYLFLRKKKLKQMDPVVEIPLVDNANTGASEQLSSNESCTKKPLAKHNEM